MCKVKVVKQQKLDGKKLLRISRKYGLKPIEIRELQQGHVVELNEKQAGLLKMRGFVKYASDEQMQTQEAELAPVELENPLGAIEDETEIVTTDLAEDSNVVELEEDSFDGVDESEEDKDGEE